MSSTARKNGRPATIGCADAVRDYLRHAPPSTTLDLAQATGFLRHTVAGIATKMAARGELIADRRGGFGRTLYRLNPRYRSGPSVSDESLPFETAAGREEIARRTAAVRAAKWRHWCSGQTTDLPASKLERVLPIGGGS